MVARTASRTRGIASASRAWMRIRNSDSVSKSCCALLTGMMTSSCRSKPTARPESASTPVTRKRRSPMRTEAPTAGRCAKSSDRTLLPMTHTARSRSSSPAGRKCPWPTASLRTCRKSAFVPMTGTSRDSSPADTGADPTTSGAIRSIAGIRNRARASSSVRSRGVSPAKSPGCTPVVSERPGSTMRRSVPSAWNSPVT